MRRRDTLLERIVVEDGQIVLLRAAQPGRGADASVVLGAWAEEDALAERALARWRRTLGVDVDHRPFLEATWHDPLLGPLVRARPWLRPTVRYRPHEALLAAITEQLIEYVEAARIQRRLNALVGVQCPPPACGLRDPARGARLPAGAHRVVRALRSSDAPDAGGVPAARARSRPRCRGRRAPRRPASAAVDPGDRRLDPRLHGAARARGTLMRRRPATLGLLKAVGRLTAAGRIAAPADGSDPTARDERERLPLASELHVHEVISRYAPWRGYAAEHLLSA